MLTLLADRRRDEELARLAKKVSHDIRSPLAALDVCIEDMQRLPESTRVLVRSATNRIQDIANLLLSHSRRPVQTTQEEPLLLASFVAAVVSEKRTLHRDKLDLSLDFENPASAYGAFAAVPRCSFASIISNLINNAVEAVGLTGTIVVRCFREDDNIVLEIIDNGPGMPAHILAQLGKPGFTHGKVQGNGRVSQAMRDLRDWGGNLTYFSDAGSGTRARIVVPAVSCPDWFAEKLVLLSKVVIVDDDLSVHRVWRDRLARYFRQSLLTSFSTPEQLCDFVKRTRCEGTTFLIDHEFIGYSDNGIDMAASLEIPQQQVYIVTSHFDNQEVIERCQKVGLKLIPKPAAAYVPLRLGSLQRDGRQSYA